MNSIYVVIPCYKVSKEICDVVLSIPSFVDKIIIVDDCCPEDSGKMVESIAKDSRIQVIRHSKNLGVGGATMTGYKVAISQGAEVVVKLDGDGQMDGKEIARIVIPIIDRKADYVKGNRFWSLGSVRTMPKVRLLGNLLLSFVAKASTGYWNLFDPNNGFTAISASVLKRLPLNNIDNRFFFETDMLFHLYLENARVAQIKMNSKYGNEKSNLKVFSAIFEFAFKHSRNLFKRIVYRYFIRDFNIYSFNLVLSLILLCYSFFRGAQSWYHSYESEVPTATGTLLLIAICFLSGLQFALNFLQYDVRQGEILNVVEDPELE